MRQGVGCASATPGRSDGSHQPVSVYIGPYDFLRLVCSPRRARARFTAEHAPAEPSAARKQTRRSRRCRASRGTGGALAPDSGNVVLQRQVARGPWRSVGKPGVPLAQLDPLSGSQQPHTPPTCTAPPPPGRSGPEPALQMPTAAPASPRGPQLLAPGRAGVWPRATPLGCSPDPSSSSPVLHTHTPPNPAPGLRTSAAASPPFLGAVPQWGTRLVPAAPVPREHSATSRY